MTDWNILVVEDDPYSQQLVKLVLDHGHIDSDVVGSAEEALALLASGKHYTAAMLDLALPGMDGWTLHWRMQNNPDIDYIPCVAMTAYHSERMSSQAKEAGFVAYFPKPLEVRGLVDELRRALA